MFYISKKNIKLSLFPLSEIGGHEHSGETSTSWDEVTVGCQIFSRSNNVCCAGACSVLVDWCARWWCSPRAIVSLHTSRWIMEWFLLAETMRLYIPHVAWSYVLYNSRFSASYGSNDGRNSDSGNELEYLATDVHCHCLPAAASQVITPLIFPLQAYYLVFYPLLHSNERIYEIL